jgi:hypothetical protein
MGSVIAATNHGYPSGYVATGCLARVVSRIISGAPLKAPSDSRFANYRPHSQHEEGPQLDTVIEEVPLNSCVRHPETIANRDRVMHH